MPKLVYRAHDYVQQKEPATQTKCVELTYRHEHYNTCRAEAKSDLHQDLTYRGSDYQPKQKSEEVLAEHSESLGRAETTDTGKLLKETI